MPLPGPPPEPFFEAQQIEWKVEAPASRRTDGEKILIAANEVGEQHEVKMTGRNYKFTLPKGWVMYDDSYKPTADTGPLPGKIEVQFVAPERPNAASIIFSYQGRPIRGESGSIFLETLKDPKMAQGVPPKQIDRLTSILGSYIGENQYVRNHTPGTLPRFKITACKTITVANNVPALSVAGEWRNDPAPGSKPDDYMQVIYLNADGNGMEVNKIELSASEREGLDNHAPIFEQVLKNLRW
jgi:hypothetical protein